MWGEAIDPTVMQDGFEAGTDIDLAIGDLPAHIAEHVLFRINAAWADALEAIERREPTIVAEDREHADINEGVSTSGGVGIYVKKGETVEAGEPEEPVEFYVRMEGDNAIDDSGPWSTPAQVLRATLPTDYSLSGPEYHASINVSRLHPDPAVARLIAALEDKVSQADPSAWTR